MTTAVERKLDLHLQQKLANHSWLESCQQGTDKAFPYRANPDGTGQILNHTICYPANLNSTTPSVPSSACPLFVVNIPQACLPSKRQSSDKYWALVELIKKESYSTTSSASSRMSKRRIAIVVGTNQIESLDPSLNRSFKNGIRSTPLVRDMASRRFGFLWRPDWQATTHVRRLYPVRKCFLLLKTLSPAQATSVREKFEQPNGRLHPNILSQVPYQSIREVILKSGPTRDSVHHFEQTSSWSPTYITLMDDDCRQLRKTGSRGLFDRVASQISLATPPSAIGTSYSVGSNELPLIQLAVKMDMAVRVAMSQIIPYSAYLPEPFFPVLVKRPNQQNFLSQLSCLGRGNSLESRRLVESGKRNGVLDDHMAFIEDGVQTSSPQRWKTKKNQRFTTLSASQIKQKQCLQALRGLSQSHAHPKKWADNVYTALDFSCGQVTDATGPMMHIFHVFDPISRMFSASRFTSAIFRREMTDYTNPLTTGQTNLLETAKTQLRVLGMSQQMVSSVEEAARASGLAIHQILQEATA